MKKQIIYIHGGDAFDTYEEYLTHLRNTEFDPLYEKRKKWRQTIGTCLGNDFEVITPTMPNKYNAKYLEWKIWFEKAIPFIKDGAVIMGHSLGGIFIAKYLSENDFSKKILATYIIAAPYDDSGADYSLDDFVLPQSLSLLEKNGGKIFLYQSKNDSVVLFDNVEKYAKELPNAKKVIFEDKGHFVQEEFPELIESIKQLC